VFPPTLPVTRERDSEKVAFEAPVKSSRISSDDNSERKEKIRKEKKRKEKKR